MAFQPRPAITTFYLPVPGILALLPYSWLPFAELMRLNRPQGFYAFYWHYAIGLSFSACTASSDWCPPSKLLILAAYLGLWVLVLRGSVCTVNDIFDQNFDRQVTRTQFRPLARRAVSTTEASIFAILQLFVLSLLTLPLPTGSYIFAGLMTLALCVYPLGKRITHFPQVVLGLAFATPIFMCHAIVNGGQSTAPLPWHTYTNDRYFRATFALYWASAIWTVISDIIYAHQDIKDDARAGVKSLAVLLGDRTKPWLSILAIFQTALLVFIGVECEFSFLYYLLCCVGTALSLGVMIITVDLRQPASCAWWFGPGARWVGCSIVSGLLTEYGYRRRGL